jgi:hypothetical protein
VYEYLQALAENTRESLLKEPLKNKLVLQKTELHIRQSISPKLKTTVQLLQILVDAEVILRDGKRFDYISYFNKKTKEDSIQILTPSGIYVRCVETNNNLSHYSISRWSTFDNAPVTGGFQDESQILSRLMVLLSLDIANLGNLDKWLGLLDRNLYSQKVQDTIGID